MNELDDAYLRLTDFGSEFEDGLSNHAPMAAEAMARRGHGDAVTHWLDLYCRRLDSAPRATEAITASNWPEALGDQHRLADWSNFFGHELRDQPWPEVLAHWWPRLLPGIAAGATHGVIRVGHVLRDLTDRPDGQPSPPHLAELATALGYWAARWSPIPGTTPPAGATPPHVALQRTSPVPDQRGGVRHRIGQLADSPAWTTQQRAVRVPRDPDDSVRFLRDLVTASVRSYPADGRNAPLMLVHRSTAPNAVLRALPALPRDLWVPSAQIAWSATAAMHAAYASPSSPSSSAPRAATPDDAFARAVDHGDEHVIKFADTALDVHTWTGDTNVLEAIHIAAERIDPPLSR